MWKPSCRRRCLERRKLREYQVYCMYYIVDVSKVFDCCMKLLAAEEVFTCFSVYVFVYINLSVNKNVVMINQSF